MHERAFRWVAFEWNSRWSSARPEQRPRSPRGPRSCRHPPIRPPSLPRSPAGTGDEPNGRPARQHQRRGQPTASGPANAELTRAGCVAGPRPWSSCRANSHCGRFFTIGTTAPAERIGGWQPRAADVVPTRSAGAKLWQDARPVSTSSAIARAAHGFDSFPGGPRSSRNVCTGRKGIVSTRGM